MTRSKQTDAVLAVLEEGGELYGLELMHRTGLRSGTLYPILHRLFERGVLTVRRESISPHTAGRPLRTYYRLAPSAAEVTP